MKVSMFTHTYPHKPLRKIKVTIRSHQADFILFLALCLIWCFASVEKSGYTLLRMSFILRPGVLKDHHSNLVMLGNFGSMMEDHFSTEWYNICIMRSNIYSYLYVGCVNRILCMYSKPLQIAVWDEHVQATVLEEEKKTVKS